MKFTDEQLSDHLKQLASQLMNVEESYVKEHALDELSEEELFNFISTLRALILGGHLHGAFQDGEFGVIDEYFKDLKKDTVRLLSQFDNIEHDPDCECHPDHGKDQS